MLTVAESALLLKRIFPNYPTLQPARPIPPKREWSSRVKWLQQCWKEAPWGPEAEAPSE